ncbi:MAG: hypothetical protein KGH87_03950 [Thaumarchaeota archaeon]|nr:hypothetical protein [Nitrososphaerota archaeon]MDE1813956.1 hypothetical protein [Nitrososphaerota archaeon]MDE1839053.1 hypothetical protein [Nitrososphaerota archaeon]
MTTGKSLKKISTNLIKSKGQTKPLAKSEQKPRTDETLSPEELKIAKLYKDGKLKFKKFKNAKELIEDLNS